MLNFAKVTKCRCGCLYNPSVTSNPILCFPCTSRSTSDLSVLLPFSGKSRGIYPIEQKNPKKAFTELNPESWAKLPKPELYSEACRCTGCGEIFRSISGFDMHREGVASERRCLTPVEMRKEGMSINARGMWITQEYDYNIH